MKKLGSAPVVIILTIMVIILSAWDPESTSKAAFQIGIAIIGWMIIRGIISLSDFIAKKITNKHVKYKYTLESAVKKFIEDTKYNIDSSKIDEDHKMDEAYAKTTGFRVLRYSTLEMMLDIAEKVISPYDTSVPKEVHGTVLDLVVLTASIRKATISNGDVVYVVSRPLINAVVERLRALTESDDISASQKDFVTNTLSNFEEDIYI